MNRALLLLAVLLSWTLPSAHAQGMKASSRLYAREKGDEIQVAIQVTVEPGWHLYHGPGEKDIGTEGAVGKPTTVEFTSAGFEIGALVYPEPRKVPEEIGDLKYTAYEHIGTFALYAQGKRTKPGLKLGELSATISGLTCQDNGVCIPYDEDLVYAGTGPDELFAKMPARPAPAPVDQSLNNGTPERLPSSAAPAPTSMPATQDFASSPSAAVGKGNGQKASAHLFAREKDGAVEVAIAVKVEPDWHLYQGPTQKDVGGDGQSGLPTTVDFDPSGFDIGGVEYPKPFEATDKIGDKRYTFYEHKGTFVLRAHGKRAKPDAKLDELSASIRGLTCQDNGQCIPYSEDLTLEGTGADEIFTAAVETHPGSTSTTTSAPPPNSSELDLWLFLLSAVGWGLFTLLMPCTYPMIPITISYFTKQAAQRKGSTLPLSLAYGVGIIGTFVLIGLVVGPPIILFASHPITNLVIGSMFIFFALTLFGAVNLQPPAFLLNVAGQASSMGGLAGVFLMGATLVVTSFTCTAPFVGTLLSAGASSGGLGRVALGMGVFGLTMAVPFVALSMLPGKVKSIPRSGEWMHSLKVTLGFVEIAAALKFISNVDLVWEWGWLSRELYLFLWVGIFLAAALYLFGMIRLKDEPTNEVSPARMTAGLVFLLLALYCGYGAMGNRMDRIMTAIIPPYSNRIGGNGGGVNTVERPILIDDYDSALARAKQEGKLLLVNFTGHTCVNCRQMEESVFKQPAVESVLNGMIEVRLHYDGPRGKEITAFQRKLLNSIAAPDYIVVDPKTGAILRRQDGPTDEEHFLKFLRGNY